MHSSAGGYRHNLYSDGLCKRGIPAKNVTADSSWLGRNRRLDKDVEKLIETSTTMVAVAIVQLLVRRLATA